MHTAAALKASDQVRALFACFLDGPASMLRWCVWLWDPISLRLVSDHPGWTGLPRLP